MRHEKNSSITSPETTPIDQMFVKDVLSKTLALLLLTIPVTRIKTDYVGQSGCVHVGFHWSDSHTYCNINEEKPKMLDLNFTKPLDLTFKRSE